MKDTLCPKCHTHLETVENREIQFLGCETCFGLWVGEGELALFVERASTPESGAQFALLLDKALRKPAGGPHALRHCPFCDTPLTRLGFGETPLVVIDRCAKHGIWLDRSELKKVVRSCRSAAHPHAPAGAPEDEGDDAMGFGTGHRARP